MGCPRLSGLSWAALRRTLNWCHFINCWCHFINFRGHVLNWCHFINFWCNFIIFLYFLYIPSYICALPKYTSSHSSHSIFFLKLFICFEGEKQVVVLKEVYFRLSIELNITKLSGDNVTIEFCDSQENQHLDIRE